MRRASLLFAVGLLACNDKDEESGRGPPATEPVCTDLTYDNFGYGFIHTWCLPCHSETVVGDRRQCSDPNVNFDTYELVRIWSLEIDRKVSGEVGGPPPGPSEDTACTGVPVAPDCTCADQSDMQMPPAGGISVEKAALLHEWVSCGAPGTPVPPSACATAVPSAGSATFASQADADAFCAAGTNHVAGDLAISASVTIDCLCGIDGTLTLSGQAADVTLPALASAGALTAVGATALTRISAPELRTLAVGDLALTGLAGFTSLDLPWLTSVAGSAIFEDLDALTTLPVGQLATLGGDLTVSGVGATTVDFTRIRTVGGDLTVTGNPLLTGIDTLKSVDSIGGDLTISGNAALAGLDVGDVLVSLGGAFTVSDNAALASIDGFTLLPAVHGVTVTDNPSLTVFDGFNTVLNADDLLVSGNGELLALLAFENLPVAAGAVTVADNPQLVFLSLPLLGSTGALTLSGNLLAQNVAFDSLTSVTGDFALSANGALTSVSGLASLEAVGGDLAITGNPELPTALAEALAAQVVVGGTVTVSGNAP